MSKDYSDGKANLMEIIKQKEREKVMIPNINVFIKMEFEKKKNLIEESYGKKIQNLQKKFGASGVDFFDEHL